jgi:hypothetical protein
MQPALAEPITDYGLQQPVILRKNAASLDQIQFLL